MNLTFDLPQNNLHDGNEIDLQKFYIARIKEVIPISPNAFSTAGVQDIAICYLVYDRENKKYFTSAERISIHIGPGSKLLDLISCILGKSVSPRNFPSGKVDVSKFIGKTISVHFDISSKGRAFILKRSYIALDKYKDIDFTTVTYATPDWVIRQQQDDTTESLSEDADANSLLNGDIVRDSQVETDAVNTELSVDVDNDIDITPTENVENKSDPNDALLGAVIEGI